MSRVEYHDDGTWASDLDRELGRQLYRVSLTLHRAFGLDPHLLHEAPHAGRAIITPPGDPR